MPSRWPRRRTSRGRSRMPSTCSVAHYPSSERGRAPDLERAIVISAETRRPRRRRQRAEQHWRPALLGGGLGGGARRLPREPRGAGTGGRRRQGGAAASTTRRRSFPTRGRLAEAEPLFLEVRRLFKAAGLPLGDGRRALQPRTGRLQGGTLRRRPTPVLRTRSRPSRRVERSASQPRPERGCSSGWCSRGAHDDAIVVARSVPRGGRPIHRSRPSRPRSSGCYGLALAQAGRRAERLAAPRAEPRDRDAPRRRLRGGAHALRASPTSRCRTPTTAHAR